MNVDVAGAVLGFLLASTATLVVAKLQRQTDEKKLENERANLKEQLNTEKAITKEKLNAEKAITAEKLAQQQTRLLNERVIAAAAQLGHDQGAVRLAGVYAMAALADDFARNDDLLRSQMCIDVLCGFLRLPDQQGAAQRPWRHKHNQEVRNTVIRTIRDHLTDGAAVSWRGFDLDFTGVVFEGGHFAGATFARKVSFIGATFTGDGVDFYDTRFVGAETVDFGYAKFTNGRTDFGEAKFGGARVNFGGAEFSGGEVNFGGANFTRGQVDFGGAQFTGGIVKFDYGRFNGGQVRFNHAAFTGSEVDFGHAEFADGQVDFQAVQAWDTPPKFNDITGSPSVLLLPPGVAPLLSSISQKRLALPTPRHADEPTIPADHTTSFNV